MLIPFVIDQECLMADDLVRAAGEKLDDFLLDAREPIAAFQVFASPQSLVEYAGVCGERHASQFVEEDLSDLRPRAAEVKHVVSVPSSV